MKNFKLHLYYLVLGLSSVVLHAGIELDYLNTLRTKASMPAFTEQANLQAAAQNHSAYMQTNNTYGHGETSTASGYTGASPSQRASHAGYTTLMVSENVSYGSNATYKSSIDGLFSAIYHRFGFLSLSNDEIGIGVSNNEQFYTYDMGNSILRGLCLNGIFSSGTYYSPCADTTKKISEADYLGRADSIKAASPKFILWPSEDASDIPPVFYEESPDPLPSHGVTGYPVSVQFNDGKFASAPTVSSLSMSDASGTLVDDIVLMNQTNDPNHKFTAYQFTLFPQERLEWGSKYDVSLIYNDGTQKTKNWCFSTRTLENVANRFYRIDNNADVTLTVVSGQSYAVYVVPNDTNDKLGGYSFQGRGIHINSYSIDGNTFYVKATGSNGGYGSYYFHGNGQKIKLVIAASDAATVPSSASCISQTDSDHDGVPDDQDAFPNDASESVDTDGDGIGNNADIDDDNDGISDADEVANGLNPLDASDAQADADGDGFSNTIEISVGSDIHSANSKPIWAPVMMGDTVIFVPYFSA